MTNRLNYLDSLRGLMMLLGILFHGLELEPRLPWISNMWNERLWSILAASIHAFRMPLFFMVSGYLAAVFLEKRGAGDFITNRWKRIIVPFIISFLTIGFLCNALYCVIALQKLHIELGAACLEAVRLTAGSNINQPPIHLWFLWYLSFFSLLLAGVEVVRVQLWRKMAPSLLAWFRKFGCFGCLLLSWPAAYLLLAEKYQDTPNLHLRINPSYFLYFLYFYIFGWFVYKIKWSLAIGQNKVLLYLLLALFLTWLRVRIYAPPAGSPSFIVLVTVQVTSVWLYIMAFVGFGQLYFASQSNLMKFIADSSYWTFLIHYPLLLLLKIAFYGQVSFAIFVFQLAITIAGCFLSYNYWVRPTYIGYFLSGKIQDCFRLADSKKLHKLLNDYFVTISIFRRQLH